MESPNGKRRVGKLMITIGALGTTAALVELLIYDFRLATGTWLIEVVALAARLLRTPGLVAEAHFMATALVGLAGGIVVFAAGAALLAYEAGRTLPPRHATVAGRAGSAAL